MSRSSDRALVEAHVATVENEVAAMLEAQVFVVVPDARVVAEAVEPQELASGFRGLGIRPLDDGGADAAAGTVAPNGELVQVEGVLRAVAPILRVVVQQRERRDRLVVLSLDDVDLAAVDRLGKLVARERERPLLEAELGNPHGRLVEELRDGVRVFMACALDVHSTSIASPKE